MSRQGTSIGFAQANASGGFKIFSFGASGNVGRQSRESENTDLLKGEYDRLIRKSISEAREKDLSKEETEKYVSGQIGGFTQDLYDQARKATSLDYGASAPIGAANRAIESVPFDPSKMDLEELKNRPD